MKNLKLLDIGKKTKFMVFSLVIIALLFTVSYTQGFARFASTILVFTVVFVGTYITQIPNINKSNFIPVLLLPLHLVGGALLSLQYFPNLGFLVKILAIVLVGALLYILSLVNNIFFVTSESEKAIPLFRVAVTWNNILLIITAIPFFAGIFKVDVNSFIQNLIVSISSFLFTIYLIKIEEAKDDTRQIGVGEKLVLSFRVMFIVFALSMAVSFFPTESFLRSLFVSSVLMGALDYTQSHCRNSLNKKHIIEYFLIILTFFIILIIFKP